MRVNRLLSPTHTGDLCRDGNRALAERKRQRRIHKPRLAETVRCIFNARVTFLPRHSFLVSECFPSFALEKKKYHVQYFWHKFNPILRPVTVKVRPN